MAARITRGQYDALLTAYREKPAEYTHAAERAGVRWRTAKRAWEEGWEIPVWARPIKTVLEEEQIAARAALRASEEKREAERAADSAVRRKERDLARLDSIEERAREAQSVRAAMSNAMSLLAVSGALSKSSIALAQRAAQDIVADAQGGRISWDRAIATLKSLAWLSVQASSVARSAMEMLRLHLGEPEQIVAVTGGSAFAPVELAIDALGEEQLRQAILDLANGQMTEVAARLVDFQSRHAAAQPRGGGSALN